MAIFTTDDLLYYLYGELNADEMNEMDNALKKEWALRQKLEVLQESLKKLNVLSLKNPRAETIEAILQYAGLSFQVQR